MFNELYVVKLNDTKGVEQVIQPSGGIWKRKLESGIASGRCGHSLTNIFDFCAILHGGVFVVRNPCVGNLLFANVTNESNSFMIMEVFFEQNHLPKDLIPELITPPH